jgi:hypothetical protein
MDVATAVRNDHRVLAGLLEQLGTNRESRPALLAELRARSTAHRRAEELQLHPVCKRVGHAHPAPDDLHERLTAAESATDADFPATLAELAHTVQRHHNTVESEILPALAAALPARRREELGRRFETQRIRELRRVGIDDTLTKEDLYIRAQRARIPGRSSMSKGELARALLLVKTMARS